MIVVHMQRSLLWPRWWRNPLRWYRMRRWRREYNARLRSDPLYRQLVEREECAFLFGSDA